MPNSNTLPVLTSTTYQKLRILRRAASFLFGRDVDFVQIDLYTGKGMLDVDGIGTCAIRFGFNNQTPHGAWFTLDRSLVRSAAWYDNGNLYVLGEDRNNTDGQTQNGSTVAYFTGHSLFDRQKGTVSHDILAKARPILFDHTEEAQDRS